MFFLKGSLREGSSAWSMTEPTSPNEKWVPQQRLTAPAGLSLQSGKRYYHHLRKQNARSWCLYFSVILYAEIFTQIVQNLLLKKCLLIMLLFMLLIRREKRALILIINPPFTPVKLSQSVVAPGVEVDPEPGPTRTGRPMQAPQDSGDSALSPRLLSNSHAVTRFQFSPGACSFFSPFATSCCE